jgi:hypothetical protein
MSEKGIFHNSLNLNIQIPLCELSINALEINSTENRDMVNPSIRIPTLVNADQAIVGRKSFFPLFAAWDIYTDYHSQDTFDYMDLDY